MKTHRMAMAHKGKGRGNGAEAIVANVGIAETKHIYYFPYSSYQL
jgi:hypothetical protein